jgi:hypothetical protein
VPGADHDHVVVRPRQGGAGQGHELMMAAPEPSNWPDQ